MEAAALLPEAEQLAGLGAASEHAAAEGEAQAEAMAALCAALGAEADAARREELGREGFKRVLTATQSTAAATAAVRAAFEAAADRSATGGRGAQVVAVWEVTKRLEGAITSSTALFSAFARGVGELGERRPKAAQALNTDHLRKVVLEAVGARRAAKEFLVAVLLGTPAPPTAEAASLAVRPAGAMGQGIFATAPLPCGQVVGEYRGEPLDALGMARRYPGSVDAGRQQGGASAYYNHGDSCDYVLRVSANLWIDAVSTDTAVTNHTRYVNHGDGDDANCAMFGEDEGGKPEGAGGRVGRMVLFTLRPIAAGEQLLFDYGPGYWEGRQAPALPDAEAQPQPAQQEPTPEPEPELGPQPEPEPELERKPEPEPEPEERAADDWDAAMEELD